MYENVWQQDHFETKYKSWHSLQRIRKPGPEYKSSRGSNISNVHGYLKDSLFKAGDRGSTVVGRVAGSIPAGVIGIFR